MEQDRVMQILTKMDAVVTDSHLVYASGNHGSAYVNKDAIYPDPLIVEELCRGIAMHFRLKGIWFDTVVGPEKGGIILAQWTAYGVFSCVEARFKDTYAVYAEKVDRDNNGDVFGFTRGYDRFVSSHRVLVVEDILTTGGSVEKVVNLVRATGGEVVGVGAICNRGGVTAEKIGVPNLFSLAEVSLDMWEPDDCPLCKEFRPIDIQLGKGGQWLETDAGKSWLARGGSIAA